MRSHLKQLVFEVTNFFKKSKNINVLDIGCNDGTLLSFPKYKLLWYRSKSDHNKIKNKI